MGGAQKWGWKRALPLRVCSPARGGRQPPSTKGSQLHGRGDCSLWGVSGGSGAPQLAGPHRGGTQVSPTGATQLVVGRLWGGCEGWMRPRFGVTWCRISATS